MSWTSTTIIRCASAVALVSAGAGMAETIVVKSTGPSAKAYPPGKSIPDNSKVALKAGDSVTILDGRGTRVLKGPGLFATTASTQTNSSIGALLRNTGTRQVRTGAVRGTGTEVSRPPNVWMIDSSKSGTVCVAGTEAVSLWAPPHEQPASLTLTRLSDGKAVPIALRPGQTVKAWPTADLPITNGSQFRVSGDGMASPISLRFATLGPDPQGLEGTASALIKAGCNAQLDLLIETVAVPSGEDAPAG